MHWLRDRSKDGSTLSFDEATAVLETKPEDMPILMFAASEVRRRRFGNSALLCSIMNARCGACSEDCAFCAQSAHHQTEVASYPMVSANEIVAAARSAAANPIDHFGVVTSGAAVSDAEVDTVCAAAPEVKQAGVIPCASLGMIGEDQLRRLKDSGVARYHHNLETARSFFPRICSTHSFDDRLSTVRLAKSVGLEVCCGGIFGMGESPEQRVELAVTLRDEDVRSIPLNFLAAIPGTPVESLEPMRPLDILKTVAMFRLVCPTAEIKVCAGRRHLRDLQSMFLYAGATGIMVGNYLTTAGRPVEEDIQLLKDLEVDFERT